MSAPLRFAFAVHIHQPVGNFDSVFREHVDEVYRPFLSATKARGCRPLVLHVSGPLLDWLERHDAAFLDEIGRGVTDGEIELLGSGRYEPILAALPRRDRVEQVEWMREDLARRFGMPPTGLWLTERVWEQDLAADLAAAGVEYTLLDDRHFLASGVARGELDRPYRTEADGRALDLLPIDERLRYLIPFRPVGEIEAFFRSRHREETGLVVLGDDGEKFGGWPGTRAWVYGGGWLDGFLDLLERLRSDGTIDLVTTRGAAALESGGLVYPTSGSYREMEEWTLPRPAALELGRIRSALEGASAAAVPDGDAGPEAPRDTIDDPSHHPAIRGGHWRNFQRRYPLSNRMHKTALALSLLCRERGDPPDARRAIARAQCNDAYWHGVFGGIYLPHLRRAVWRELATAERLLRAGQPLGAETVDHDVDGRDEVLVHGPSFSAVVSPHRGGAVESLLRLDSGENDVDVLVRHFEAYHGEPGIAPEWADVRELWLARAAAADDPPADEGGAASIHDREPLERPAPPGIDEEPAALLRDRIGDAGGGVVGVEYVVSRTQVGEDSVVLELAQVGGSLLKRLELSADGTLRASLRWDPTEIAEASDGRRSPWVWIESRFAHERRVTASRGGREVREPIVTLARSERGYEEIRQGEAVRLGWPASVGSVRITLSRDR